MSGSGRIAALAAFIGIVGGHYLWSASSSGNPFVFARQPADFYGLLTEALLAGRLHVSRTPPAELLALPDPYDSVANRAFRVANETHDLSLYRGRFYVYFGAAPVATLFGPFRLLTGRHLPENLALAVFLFAGFALSLATLRLIEPGAWRSMAAPVVLLLGFCNYAPFLLRRPRSYEVAIAAGACFALLGVHALVRGLRPDARAGWLTLAGAGFGLALASRPTHVLGLFLLGAASLVLLNRPSEGRARRLAALWLPWLATLAAVLAYNAARFEDPLEFGMRYQLTEWNQRRVRMFSPEFVPVNVLLNFFAVPMLGPEFPFFRLAPARLPPLPAGFQAVEAVAGVFACVPAVAIALLWPVWLRSSATARIGLLLMLQAALIAALVCCFGVASIRYQLDFLPLLLLSAALAWLHLYRTARPSLRIPLAAGFGGLVAYSTCLNLGVGLTGYYDWLKRLNPETYFALEDAFLPVQRLWLALHGDRYGALRLSARFARPSAGDSEALLAVGGLYRHDVLCVRYLEGDDVVFRFQHRGAEPIRSRRVALSRGEPHVLDVEMGSLLPVNARVLQRLWPEREVEELSRRFVLKLDGVELLSGRYDFIPSLPQQVVAGTDRVGNDQCPAPFSGRFDEVSRRGASAAPRAAAPRRAAW